MQTPPTTNFARIDPITCLPNRQQFIADYNPAHNAQLVMMTLADAQHFNELLRAIGHEYSEDFMRAGAARLRDALPPAITIYHVSVLSFAFIFPDGATVPALQAICECFKKPVTCGGIPVVTAIALGYADCTDSNPANVLRAALAAAQDCRSTGAEWARYNRKTDTAHQRGFVLLSHLTAALESPGQFSLNFQPKYAMATGKLTSAEALLRWNHPIFGPISPGEFVPLAEATAHIHPLSDWVMRNALAQAGIWAQKGMDLNIAINVSPRNLSRRGFALRFAKLLKISGVRAAAIELEFTEGVLAANDQIVLDELQALRDIGIRIALDDFGTGFANFSYITHLPADIIKIDKSFIQKIATDERSAMVVRSIIELAHRLDYSVVAEGIENARAFDMLAEWKCDEGQGFYMSPPLNAASLVQIMQINEYAALAAAN